MKESAIISFVKCSRATYMSLCRSVKVDAGALFRDNYIRAPKETVSSENDI